MMPIIIGFLIVFLPLMFLCALAGSLNRQPGGNPLVKRAREIEESAPIIYPYVVKLQSLAANGAPPWPSTLEVTPEAIRVLYRGSTEVLCYVPMSRITSVLYEDKTKGNHAMAGFAINTTLGQLQFFSEGLLAPGRMRKAASVIARTYETEMGSKLVRRDLTPATALTPDGMFHKV